MLLNLETGGVDILNNGVDNRYGARVKKFLIERNTIKRRKNKST